MCTKEQSVRLKFLHNKKDLKELSKSFGSYEAKMKKCSWQSQKLQGNIRLVKIAAIKVDPTYSNPYRSFAQTWTQSQFQIEWVEIDSLCQGKLQTQIYSQFSRSRQLGGRIPAFRLGVPPRFISHSIGNFNFGRRHWS